AQRLLCRQALPRSPAPHPLSRSRNWQDPGVSDKPVCAAGADHLRPVPVSMAGRTLLQMDQAAFADQALLRHLGERGADANLDCISVYVLVAIIKKQLRLDVTLHTLLQILSLTLFEKLPLQQAFVSIDPAENNLISDRQLKLFEF